MKQYILLLALIFFSSHWLQAQGTEAPGGCVQEDGCLRFNYLGATESQRGNSTLYSLTYTLQVNCETALDYVAFELPEGSRAASPANDMQQNRNYVVRNGRRNGNSQNAISTPYNAVQFNAKNNYTLNGGAIDTFRFHLSAEDYANMSSMRVQAKAGGSVGNALFNLSAACNIVPTDPQRECFIDLGDASFAFLGAVDDGSGNTAVAFQIQNNLAADVEEVTIEVPAAAQPITVIRNNAGASYTANFKYKVTVGAESNIITFSAQNTKGYANGQTDVFAFALPTDAYNEEPYFQLTVTAGGTTTNTGFNTITCRDQPIDPLPVELISFEGKPTPSGIELTWATASETDNDRFEVERSQNGKSFTAIGAVEGAGSSSTRINYTFTDASAKAGLHYYRIKQVDFDGTSETSKVIAVENERAAATADNLSVYPNPVTGKVVHVALEPNTGTMLQIRDLNGRTVYSQAIEAGQRRLELSIAELQLKKGMYLVILQNGQTQETQKLFIR